VCTKGKVEEHVEVKGIRGEGLAFIITANEMKQAKVDPEFKLCAVNSALSDEPLMNSYTGAEFLRSFKTDVLAFRAISIRKIT
jgi:hypothetical protein